MLLLLAACTASACPAVWKSKLRFLLRCCWTGVEPHQWEPASKC